MSLDEEVNEDLVIRDSRTGKVFMSFDTVEGKNNFEKILFGMSKTANIIKDEGYKCGHCAAYPCFRTGFSKTLLDEHGPITQKFLNSNSDLRKNYERIAKEEALQSAGLCFQSVRKCRQECDSYNYNKFPADGGICKIDELKVEYGQTCHIQNQIIKDSKI